MEETLSKTTYRCTETFLPQTPCRVMAWLIIHLLESSATPCPKHAFWSLVSALAVPRITSVVVMNSPVCHGSAQFPLYSFSSTAPSYTHTRHRIITHIILILTEFHVLACASGTMRMSDPHVPRRILNTKHSETGPQRRSRRGLVQRKKSRHTLWDRELYHLQGSAIVCALPRQLGNFFHDKLLALTFQRYGRTRTTRFDCKHKIVHTHTHPQLHCPSCALSNRHGNFRTAISLDLPSLSCIVQCRIVDI